MATLGRPLNYRIVCVGRLLPSETLSLFLTYIPDKNGAKMRVLYTFLLKGNIRSKKSLAQMKEREKCKKNEPSPTSMRQMVLEIFHFKVKNLSNMDVAIL